jgi:tetratricopeptide (TPR) repeat protein
MLIKRSSLGKKVVLALSCFVILCNPLSFGQNKYDFPAFKNEKNHLRKAKMALELSQEYVRYNIDSLKILAEELKKSSNKNAFTRAISCRILGIYEVRKGDFSNGIVLLKAAKNYSLSMQDLELLTSDVNELGNAYFLKGDFKTAEFYYKTSLDIGEDSPNETDAFLALVNLARIHILQKKYSEAKQELEKYIFLATKNEKWEAVANAYAVFADLALEQKNNKLAKLYCENSFSFSNKTMKSYFYLNALTNKAIIFFLSNEKKQALELFQKILRDRKTENIPHKIFEAYFNLADYFWYFDKLVSKTYIDSCTQLAKKQGLLGLELEAIEFKIDELKLIQFKDAKAKLELKIRELENNNKKERDKLRGELISGNFIEKKEINNNSLMLFAFFSALLFFMVFQIRKKTGK